MGTMTLSGDISTFLEALGSPADHPEALGRAIGLVGPGLEIEAFGRPEVADEHWHFRRTGSGFLLHGGEIVAIVLPVVRAEGPVYDGVGTLIDGVDLAGDRASIVTAIGEATRSSQRMDLWRLDGRYLRLEFADDRLSDVTTALGGVEL